MALKNGLREVVATVLLPVVLLGSACSNREGGWIVETKKDAMTDVATTTGSTKITGNVADLELTAYCGKDGEAYRFRTFDKDGEPLGFSGAQAEQFPIKQMLIRIDDAAPYTIYDSHRSYVNQFDVVTPRSRGFGKAQEIVARLPLIGGVETFTIKQGDAEFRKMMAPCIKQYEGARHRLASTDVPQAPPTPSPETSALPAEASTTKPDCWTPPSGPNVIDDPDHPISFHAVEEIQQATGRPYQSGDSIYGRVEDRCPS